MKQNEVIVEYAPWKGAHQVAPEDALALVVIGYEVNGHRLHSSHAKLIVDGFLFTLVLEVPEYAVWDEFRVKNIAYAERCIAEIRDELTAEDWLEETTDDVLVLPIAKLEMRERPLSFWKHAA